MSYEFTGKVIYVGELEQFASGFSKRVVVIDDMGDKYPQQVPFVFAGKKANEVNAKGVRVGDEVTVKFDLRGREWNGKYFGENSAWDIKRLGDRATRPTEDENQQSFPDDDILDEDVPF